MSQKTRHSVGLTKQFTLVKTRDWTSFHTNIFNCSLITVCQFLFLALLIGPSTGAHLPVAVCQTEAAQSGKQCSFLHFWTFHGVAVMKVDMWSMTSCQWAAFLSSCTSEVTGLLMTSSGFIAGLLLLLCSPQGSPPSIQAHKQLTQHGWLDAWLASLLIVLNQEMWGIKMQQVSSCMPSGVHFVRQSDEAERKKPLMLHTHPYRETVWGTHLYVRRSRIQFTWVLAQNMVLDTVVVHCEITTAQPHIFKALQFLAH